ncbi:TetR/AcrR family transcriptional regulator [Umezawaea sp. Da 62-37]|uniref:TetR/AcrR family transcriptional regulator n=1 Tax=Umezawaea sp. Da 62-37 TaxID=3075927 RepID=UPI0028F71051|nr:TetR/AcrR family transcriptional regulator [Umezawaea sp. Da 62-37]WNV87377.1 TetR/AcrR family transcriptional regulator [Umezawaea sp. Da 62-37]
MPHAARRAPNRRGQGGHLREEIVRAAARLLEESGVDGVTLRAVARSAGITAPSIYAHFADLNDVLQAVVDNTFHALTTHLHHAVDGVTDPVVRLRTAIRAYVDFGLQQPNQYRVLFAVPPADRRDQVDKDMGTMTGADAFAFLLDGIRDCVAAGRSRSEDPETDATALWLALHGYVGTRATLHDFPWPADDKLLDTLVRNLAQLSG